MLPALKNPKTTLVLATICASAMGCGSVDSRKTSIKPESFAPELTGDWRTSCRDLDFLGISKAQTTMKFNGVGGYERVMDITNEENCKETGVQLAVAGTFEKAGKANVDDSDAENFNFTVNEAKVVPKTDDAAAVLNKASYCGVTDWQKDKTVDILAKDCLGEELNKGDVIFDVLDKDGDTIYMGRSLLWINNSGSQDRPTKIDREVGFQKK